VIHKVVLGDAKEFVPTLDDWCADVVFLDPPYTLRKDTGSITRPEGGSYDGVTEGWDTRFDTREEHLDFIEWYLLQAQRLVCKEGTVWVMGMHHNIHDVGSVMLDLGYFILNDVVWVKTNPAPQFRGVRFTNSVEFLIWAQPHGKGKKYFDYHGLKELNGGKQMRADWKLPVCRGRERVKGPDGKKLHSTQKPLALLERVVLSSVPEDGLIVDFMAGVGTTGVAAAALGRSAILVEQVPEYVDAICDRYDALGIELYVEEL